MTKSEFVKVVESCRKAYAKASEKEEQLFAKLESEFNGLDLEDCPSNAENADNVKEAIACYMLYGEYEPEEIWNEIQMANYAHQ